MVSLKIPRFGFRKKDFFTHQKSLQGTLSSSYFHNKESLVQSLQELKSLYQEATPVAVEGTMHGGRTSPSIPGTGVYFRLDYWAQITSGGSYGHTCYVAKELSGYTDDFICFMGNRYPMLDDLGIAQIVLGPAYPHCSEEAVIESPRYYYHILKNALKQIHPAFIYERYCLANYTAAKLSLELGIPYILEYNGSEATLKRSFDNCPYKYEEYYFFHEVTLFRQATAIVVVSEVVKDDLLKRQVPSSKILVNPNGVDPETYKPLSADSKKRLRAELGYDDSHCVVGFIGSFGGWHGIGVLADSLHPICSQNENIRFLIIGDGNYKKLLDQSVSKHRLHNVVTCTGRVPQHEGCRLLGACDLFVSPHDSHMIDSPFFGSPTKVFEYMAMQEGIVASDLGQIGEVLSPAIRPADFQNPSFQIDQHRSVLCTPGNVDEMVEGVLYLSRNPRIAKQLGKNARQAVLEKHSWHNHVNRIVQFVTSL